MKSAALSRRMTFRGLDISIETDKGELRHWYDKAAKKSGTTKMLFPYGYIRRTEGTDGDHVDCYVGPNEDAPNVHIVNQQKAPDFTKFDEQKCMLGFDNAAQAKKAYLDHYDNERFFGSMTIMPVEEFKRKVLTTMNNPQKVAQDISRRFRQRSKFSQSLGDPNYWQQPAAAAPEEEAPPEGMAPPQPPTAEQLVSGLPAGTFQGLQLKLSPDGQRSTTIRVTPDAIGTPEGLQSIFAAEPNAKVEISAAQAQASAGGGAAGNVPGPPSVGELGELIHHKAAAYGRYLALSKFARIDSAYDPRYAETFGVRPGSGIPGGMTQVSPQTLGGVGGVPPGMAHAATQASAPPGMTAAAAPASAPTMRPAPLPTAVTKLDPTIQNKLRGAASHAAPSAAGSGSKLLQRLGPRGRMLGMLGGGAAIGAGAHAALAN